MSSRLVSKSVNLNDLERRNGPYFSLFHQIRVRYFVVKQWPTSVLKYIFDSLWPYWYDLCNYSAIIWAKQTL